MIPLDILAQDAIEGRQPQFQFGGQHSIDPNAYNAAKSAISQMRATRGDVNDAIYRAMRERYGLTFKFNEVPTRHQAQAWMLLISDARRSLSK